MYTSSGGRGIAVGPILGNDGFSDMYFVNEGNWRLGNPGDNTLFKNDGSGRFTNVASQYGKKEVCVSVCVYVMCILDPYFALSI